MIFTTNKPLAGWGRVLHDEDLADAIVDQILERGRMLTLDGPSTRRRHVGLDPGESVINSGGQRLWGRRQNFRNQRPESRNPYAKAGPVGASSSLRSSRCRECWRRALSRSDWN
jgi:hypothetical protein